MTAWWISLPAFFRYIILIRFIPSLIICGFFNFILFQKLSNKRVRTERTSEQIPAQEVDLGVLSKIELKNAYKYYKIFRPVSIIFEQPAILKIDLKANNAPLQKGMIKFEFITRFESDGRDRLGMSFGPGPFYEIEIPALKPQENMQIKMITKIGYIERLVNPVSLNLVVFDSKGNRRGHKTLYFNLKTKEEAREEVRGKIIFVAVLLTFFITLVTFSKDILIPLFRIISNLLMKR